MATAKQIKAALANFGADMVRKKGNTIEVKRGYFYRFDRTAGTWADSVREVLRTNGIDANVTSRDDFRAWPDTSYFVAIVEISEGQGK